ncbi:MAG: hypothetical protein KDD44_01050 [Bdellovibrionales bacterium]|nr:hypothetical protein [Bdellovibrionales bacterium]
MDQDQNDFDGHRLQRGSATGLSESLSAVRWLLLVIAVAIFYFQLPFLVLSQDSSALTPVEVEITGLDKHHDMGGSWFYDAHFTPTDGEYSECSGTASLSKKAYQEMEEGLVTTAYLFRKRCYLADDRRWSLFWRGFYWTIIAGCFFFFFKEPVE